MLSTQATNNLGCMDLADTQPIDGSQDVALVATAAAPPIPTEPYNMSQPATPQVFMEQASGEVAKGQHTVEGNKAPEQPATKPATAQVFMEQASGEVAKGQLTVEGNKVPERPAQPATKQWLSATQVMDRLKRFGERQDPANPTRVSHGWRSEAEMRRMCKKKVDKAAESAYNDGQIWVPNDNTDTNMDNGKGGVDKGKGGANADTNMDNGKGGANTVTGVEDGKGGASSGIPRPPGWDSSKTISAEAQCPPKKRGRKPKAETDKDTAKAKKSAKGKAPKARAKGKAKAKSAPKSKSAPKAAAKQKTTAAAKASDVPEPSGKRARRTAAKEELTHTPGADELAKQEKKKLQSRKSSAYHKAMAAAKKQGLAEEECKAAAKRAIWMHISHKHASAMHVYIN